MVLVNQKSNVYSVSVTRHELNDFYPVKTSFEITIQIL